MVNFGFRAQPVFSPLETRFERIVERICLTLASLAWAVLLYEISWGMLMSFSPLSEISTQMIAITGGLELLAALCWKIWTGWFEFEGVSATNQEVPQS